MKKNIKSFLLFLVALSTQPVVAQQSDSNTWPWDFPKGTKQKFEVGQTVLSPYTYYPSSVEKGEDLTKSVLIFYDTTVKQVGDETSILDNYNKDVEIPNALIIPLPKKAKAKKGDILLTWWQSGSGMQRAIVVDASNPEEPVVCYFDTSWPDNPDSPKLEEKRKGEKIKPGTFAVLKDGQWQSGAQIAAKCGNEWRIGTLISVNGDKVLSLGFGSKVEAYNKSDVRIIPFKEKIKVGDKVYVKWVNEYRPGYVVEKIDAEIGRIYVKQEGKNGIESKSLADVTKVLN